MTFLFPRDRLQCECVTGYNNLYLPQVTLATIRIIIIFASSSYFSFIHYNHFNSNHLSWVGSWSLCWVNKYRLEKVKSNDATCILVLYESINHQHLCFLFYDFMNRPIYSICLWFYLLALLFYLVRLLHGWF